MSKITTIFILIFIINISSFGQSLGDRVAFVVDSISVVNDPAEGDEILQTDISDIVIINNKDSLNFLGYKKFDRVTFIFTKEYRGRPEDIKKIPSTKQMERKNGVWFLNNSPFNGRFIDYYYSGRKQGEGTLRDGIVNGPRKIYYQNGKVSMERYYKDGIRDSLEIEYYEDGSLKQKGLFVGGKEEGIWEAYFSNGQVRMRNIYKSGALFDTATKYYSTGKIKEKALIKDGKVIADPITLKINLLLSKSNESNKLGDTNSAINFCSKIIRLDSTYSDAYFLRGIIKLNNLRFDEAIADFDKALNFEPLMGVAMVNRAFA